MSKDDIISIIKGAGIAGVGAALTVLTQWATSTDFGAWTPLIVAGLSILANVVRKASTGGK